MDISFQRFLILVPRGGRFSDGWGSCDRREKKFLKPNNDIPSTAETRAKNKACQVCVFLLLEHSFKILLLAILAWNQYS